MSKKEFGTDEYNQKVWEIKISRTDVYEKEMSKIQKKIWNAQERDIMKNLASPKGMKKIDNEDELFDEKKYNLLYITLYTKYFEEMMTKE
jgi:hypothetical protein